MGYKEELLKKIEELRKYQKLRKEDPDKAVNVKNLIKVREDYLQVSKFLNLFQGRSNGYFADKDAMREFVNNHKDLIPGEEFPNLKMGEYGVLTVPDVNYKAILEAFEKDTGKSEEELNIAYENAKPNIRGIRHPLSEISEAIKADADALFDENVAKELKASIDFANEEIVAKTGTDIMDDVMYNNSDLPGIKAHNGFKDFVRSKGLDENVVVNHSVRGASVSGNLFDEKNYPIYKPFLNMECELDQSHTSKILELDELIKKEGLLSEAQGGESDDKEYGLVDYFQKVYRLKKAMTDHTKKQSDDEKRESLINIDRLTKEVKDVSARYDRVFDFIEKNFDLENTNFSGNLYGGRPKDVGEGGVDQWRPNLPPKYDFENSPKVIFLSGYCQLKASCQAADVSLEEYLNNPTKAFKDGVKKIVEKADQRYYLPRSEENTLGKRMARMLVNEDMNYPELSGYSMMGGRGMEFLTNTDPVKENQAGNAIITSMVGDFYPIFDHSPTKYFGISSEPQLNNIKNIFAFAHKEDNLYKVSDHYHDENGNKSEIYKQYSQVIKEHQNPSVEGEYRRIMTGLKDYASERQYIYDHNEEFTHVARDGTHMSLSSHSLGTLLYAGRDYFLDYMKENNLSIASIQDEKLRNEVTSFLTNPLDVMEKHIKPEDYAPESTQQIRQNYAILLGNHKASEAPEFFNKFNEFNNKPNGSNVGKNFTQILNDNKGSWWERLRGKTSKEYKALQKVAREVAKPNCQCTGDDKALYVCAKAYKNYKMPEGTDFNRLSSTAKKRVEFCDSVIKAYEARHPEELQQENQQIVENNNNNLINQEEFQNQLQNDLNPQIKNNQVEKVEVNNANEKNPPDEGLEP